MRISALYLENINNHITLELYHGSNSAEITGPIRMNERDSGWFGNGFYLTAYPEYAKRWGNYIYKMEVTGNFADIHVVDGYTKIDYIGDAKIANQEAGGNLKWIENEHQWAKDFTNALKRFGYDGIRIQFDDNPDVEVVIFDPQKTITNKPVLVTT